MWTILQIALYWYISWEPVELLYLYALKHNSYLPYKCNLLYIEIKRPSNVNRTHHIRIHIQYLINRLKKMLTKPSLIKPEWIDILPLKFICYSRNTKLLYIIRLYSSKIVASLTSFCWISYLKCTKITHFIQCQFLLARDWHSLDVNCIMYVALQCNVLYTFLIWGFL